MSRKIGTILECRISRTGYKEGKIESENITYEFDRCIYMFQKGDRVTFISATHSGLRRVARDIEPLD